MNNHHAPTSSSHHAPTSSPLAPSSSLASSPSPESFSPFPVPFSISAYFNPIDKSLIEPLPENVNISNKTHDTIPWKNSQLYKETKALIENEARDIPYKWSDLEVKLLKRLELHKQKPIRWQSAAISFLELEILSKSNLPSSEVHFRTAKQIEDKYRDIKKNEKNKREDAKLKKNNK